MRTLCLAVFCLVANPIHAGWLDWITQPASTGAASTATAQLGALTQDEMARGLKEALAKGVNQAVANLGKDGGFLKNLDVKIPMPPQLQTVEKTLRKLHQDQMADEFVATLNHAAEQAVPVAAGVFAGAITNMTVDDAKTILTGPNDAATQYFRKTSEAQLSRKPPPKPASPPRTRISCRKPVRSPRSSAPTPATSTATSPAKRSTACS